jgi:hypothetical protein
MTFPRNPKMNNRIIELAKEAGISFGGHPMNPLNVYPSQLERFAHLVEEDFVKSLLYKTVVPENDKQ